MLRIVICDDNPFICKKLREMLIVWSQAKGIEFQAEIFEDGNELLLYVEKHENEIDIIFLDIEIVNIRGDEIGTHIRTKLMNYKMKIIYISENPIRSASIFRTHPIDFLEKPIIQADLNGAMDYCQILEVNPGKVVEVYYEKKLFCIPEADIYYFYSEGKKVFAVTKQKIYEFYGKLQNVSEITDDNFIRIHKSFLVNTRYIREYSYESVEVADGKVLSISKPNRKMVRSYLMSVFSEKNEMVGDRSTGS